MGTRRHGKIKHRTIFRVFSINDGKMLRLYANSQSEAGTLYGDKAILPGNDESTLYQNQMFLRHVKQKIEQKLIAEGKLKPTR